MIAIPNRNPERVSRKHLLIAIIALAVLLRIGAALYLGDRVEPISGAYDQVSYDALAQRLLAGHGFSFPVPWYPFTPADRPTAHWSYLYTVYLAGVYAVFGHHPLAARLIQAIVSGLHCWFAYRISRRLFGETVGMVAAALTAVYAYFIFFNAALMTQTFYILALLFVLDLTLQIRNSAIRNPQSAIRHWLFLGLALGIGALLRQTLLLFAPILLAWLWRSTPSTQHALRSTQYATRNTQHVPRFTFHISRFTFYVSRFTFHVSPLACVLAVMGLLILPWTAYNYAAFGDFLLLNSNGGYWFWASNHPSRGTHFDGNYAPAIPEELHGLGEPALDRALYRRGLEFILSDPLRFLRLSLSRINGYFWLLPSAQSSLLSNLGRVFSFALYLPFMLYGLWLSRRHWRACLPLYLYVAFDTVLHLISWAAPRYRLPSDAVMIIFAALAVVSLMDRLKARFGFLLNKRLSSDRQQCASSS